MNYESVARTLVDLVHTSYGRSFTFTNFDAMPAPLQAVFEEALEAVFGDHPIDVVDAEEVHTE